MSATLLKLLLRDPIRFVWRYALGWRQPEESEEPLTLDALAFGILVHEILQTVVSTLEADGGFAKAKPQALEKALKGAVATVASRWESEQAVPPPVIWRNALEATRAVSARALTYRLDPMPNQKSCIRHAGQESPQRPSLGPLAPGGNPEDGDHYPGPDRQARSLGRQPPRTRYRLQDGPP